MKMHKNNAEHAASVSADTVFHHLLPSVRGMNLSVLCLSDWL